MLNPLLIVIYQYFLTIIKYIKIFIATFTFGGSPVTNSNVTAVNDIFMPKMANIVSHLKALV